MESKVKSISQGVLTSVKSWIKPCCFTILAATLYTATASAETYRWVDKDGKTHFGSAVPAEYADLPYDVISKSGLVLRRVEPNSVSPEVQAANEKKELETQKDTQSRQEQSDRLLLIKYQSEEAIEKALELELDQVGYDSMLINKSFANTNAAIIDKVRLAADQQRAGIAVSDAQTAELKKLYRALDIDKNKLAAMDSREEKVRAEFAAILVRYQELVKKYNDDESSAATEPGDPETVEKEQS